MLLSTPLSLLPLLLCTMSIVQSSGENTTKSNSEGILLGSPCNTSDKDSCHPQSVYVCQPQAASEGESNGNGNDDGKCECRKEGYVPYWTNQNLQTCLPEATRIGAPCRIHEQCGDLENDRRSSYCFEGAGVCPSFLVSADNGTKCLSTPGVSCQEASECFGDPELTECSGGDGRPVCRCRKGISIEIWNGHEHECLPLRHHLGQSCKDRRQCQQINQECSSNGTCSCVPGSTFSQGQCYFIARYAGQECEVDAQCRTNLGPTSACSQSELLLLDYKFCTCVNGTVPINNFTSCGPGRAPIGWECESSSSSSSSICTGPKGTSLCGPARVCERGQGYVASAALDTCLPIRNNLGEDCDKSLQCGKGFHRECRRLNSSAKGVCTCAKGWMQPSGERDCYKIASKLEDPCNKDVQCVVGFASTEDAFVSLEPTLSVRP